MVFHYHKKGLSTFDLCLLAYFYAQQLDSPCGSIVFAYHNQREANDTYTAGRINFDITV